VTPRHFTIAPGQSQALKINLTAAQGAAQHQPLAIVLKNGQDGRTVTIAVALRNPGIEAAPDVIEIPAPAADGHQPVTATVNGTVHPTGFGLATPQVRTGLQTVSPEFPELQSYTLPLTLAKDTQMLAAKTTSHDPAAPKLLTRIFRDVDGDGRWTPIDQNDEVSLPQDFDGPVDEADAIRLAAGKYLVQINAIEPYPKSIGFDLRTWVVDDPAPDDPQPAPGLVVDGDVDFLAPAQEHAFDVRFNGIEGTEPLRGLIEWDGAGDGNVLARSVVRVTPGQN
jgi:hypothetical protein